MAITRSPIAFLSYVHADDQHEGGKISQFRARLEGEIRMHTGRSFPIFQDRNDLDWGKNWKTLISSSLAEVTFLIPIVTPSFFESPACREEFTLFLLREKTLGIKELILPVYYLTADQMESDYKIGSDPVADVMRQRQWTDWRPFRFKNSLDETVSEEMAKLAMTIKRSIQNIQGIAETAARKSTATAPVAPKKAARTRFGTDRTVSPAQVRDFRAVDDSILDILELNPLHGKVVVALDKSPYHVFTRRYDEIIKARELSDAAEITKLHEYVVDHSKKYSKLYANTIIKFESKLKRLKRDQNVSVSFLLDNSGSMRGSKVLDMAAWISIVSQSLEKLSIGFEILGFTTKTWKGGQSRELWVDEGRAVRPGRLNDLRHIIYKDFTEPLADSAPNIGIMVRDGILKENIDGEALIWAYQRLAKKVGLKILIIVSDGTPVDDSTLSVMNGDYLYKHAKEVAEWISVQPDITFQAIGIDHDVTTLYGDTARFGVSGVFGPLLMEAISASLA